MAIAHAAGPVSNGPPRLAVLEFEAKPGAEAWAAGLGDLMEVSLQKAGAELVTRRFVALVLNERRAQRTGLVGDGRDICAQLPGVDMLVKGAIARGTNSDFVLEAHTLDACGGAEQRSFSERGNYPADLVPALDRLALHLAGGDTTRPAPDAPELPGFTQVPEAMIFFYQGLEHLHAGRPEYAASDFHAATRTDPSFLAAFRWGARAYTMLGLPWLADVEYEDERAAQKKFGGAWISGGTGATQVVTVFFRDKQTPIDPALAAQCKEGLRAEPGLTVLEPNAVRELSAEHDLRLTGDFAALAHLDRRAWLQSDVGVDVARSGDTLTARAFSLIDGAPHGVCTGTVSDATSLCRGIGRMLRERAGVAGPAAVAPTGPEPERISILTSYADADLLPVTLLRYALQPMDPERADDLADQFIRDVGYKRHRLAMAEHLLAQSQSLSTSDPALRLHAAHLLQMCSDPGRDFGPIYAELAQACSGTVVGACAEYSLGLIDINKKRYADALRRLDPAMQRIHPLVAPGSSCAGAFFLPAYAAWTQGDLPTARRYMDIVNAHLRADPAGSNTGVPDMLEVVRECQTNLPWASPGQVHRVGGDDHLRLGDTLYYNMRGAYHWLDQTLRQGAPTDSLDLLYWRLRDAKGGDAFAIAEQYFPAIIAAKATDHSLAKHHREGYAAFMLHGLRQQATNEAQRARLREWAGTLSAQCRPDEDKHYDFALAVGDWAWAEQLVEAGKPGIAAFRCAWKITLQQHGIHAAARRCGEVFDTWPAGNRDAQTCRCAVLAATAVRRLGEADRARKYYEYALTCRTKGHELYELSAKIDLADLEREQGNIVRATELLKEVMADPDARFAHCCKLGDGLDDPLGCGEWVHGTGYKVYEKAAQLLQQVRGGTPEAAKR